MMQIVLCLLAASVLAQNNLANFKCPANGYAVALGCSTSEQCTPYTINPVDCIGNACCIRANNSDQISPHPASLICSNNGTAVVIGCTKSEQCLPFTNEPVACLQGICCTVPQKCPNGGRVIGLQCTTSQSCVPLAGESPVQCLNSMCCTV